VKCYNAKAWNGNHQVISEKQVNNISEKNIKRINSIHRQPKTELVVKKRKFEECNEKNPFYCFEFASRKKIREINFIRIEWLENVEKDGSANTRYPEDLNKYALTPTTRGTLSKWKIYKGKVCCNGHSK
jgi:hypothetical protein